jgi:hypothetical protein
MGSTATPAPNELPATLAWHRDDANWIVGLSTGALAGAIAYKSDIVAAPLVTQVIVLAAVICFVASVLSGIQFYIWITSYGNSREFHDRRTHDLTTQPAAEHDKIQADITSAKQSMEIAQRRYGYFHTILLWVFHLGGLLFAVGMIALFMHPKPPERSWELVSMPCCPAVKCRIPQPHVLRIEKTTGETWFLTGDSTHAGVWQRIQDADSLRTRGK